MYDIEQNIQQEIEPCIEHCNLMLYGIVHHFVKIFLFSPGLLTVAAGLGTRGAKAVPASEFGTDWQVQVRV